jgi:hypothetical protein
MRLILIILLTFPLITISCIDKEFEEELKFVQSIIDYPDDMKNIIETSKFYDSTFIDLQSSSFITYIDYLKNESKDFSYSCYKGSITRKLKQYQGLKIIDVFDRDSKFALSFSFKQNESKWILIDIAFSSI